MESIDEDEELQPAGLVQRHVKDDAKFAEALLREGIDAMLGGDLETGKTIMRDYIKATIGFEKLGAATGAPPKSLIRMFGPRGNPQARNLFSVIGYLQKACGRVRLPCRRIAAQFAPCLPRRDAARRSSP